jgi:hypothetical protein
VRGITPTVSHQAKSKQLIWRVSLVRVVFYEVKQFADPRIRARETAEVVGTLKDYEDAITNAKDDIIIGYHQVCLDLQKIGRPVSKPGPIDELIEKAAGDRKVLEVDLKPRLVIVGYTDPQWKHKQWQDQLRAMRSKGVSVNGWGKAADVKLQPQPFRVKV